MPRYPIETMRAIRRDTTTDGMPRDRTRTLRARRQTVELRRARQLKRAAAPLTLNLPETVAA